MIHSNHNYILTGCTGILGSHIFYELLLDIHNNNYDGHIVLLLRSRKDQPVQARFDELFNARVVPDYLGEIDTDRIRANNITLIDFDLRFSGATELAAMPQDRKYHLIHCAASVNLGTNAYAFDEIKHNNYLGTLNLIHSLHGSLLKVSYISTAFSLSSKSGAIYDSGAVRAEDDYRNHYEKYKVQTEHEVTTICDAYELPSQIFRPSIICGRLVDYPHHVIPRFLVFYLFGAFFYRVKATVGEQPVRIKMNLTSGLNLIPVDYAAKAIVRALATDIKELNIVSKKSVPNTYTIPEALRQVNWCNYEFTDTIPDNMTQVEKLYYRTVGPQLNDYLDTPGAQGNEFNITELSALMSDIAEPDVAGQFPMLMNYAVANSFNNILA